MNSVNKIPNISLFLAKAPTLDHVDKTLDIPPVPYTPSSQGKD
jgi:hypothetical protein